MIDRYADRATGATRFHHVEEDRWYSRISGGVVFPGKRLGWCCVVAEGGEYRGGQPLKYLLEAQSFEDLEVQLRWCDDAYSFSGVDVWHGDVENDDAMIEVRRLKDRLRLRHLEVHPARGLSRALKALPFYARLVKAHLRPESKTLVLGGVPGFDALLRDTMADDVPKSP